ncbi:MAG: ribonuclease HII [Candidatus Micrarchaeia archaeon]
MQIIIAGCDEAGRGAVLGPLVVGFASISKSKEKQLSSIGVRDSKLLTRRKREFLYDEISSIAEEVKAYQIKPEEINKAMRANISLNELEAIYFARMVDEAENVEKVFVDSPDVIQEKFGIRISLLSKKPMKVDGIKSAVKKGGIKIVSEHKADVKYPIVSAASIIAKVVRDREMDKLSDSLGIDLGSGYPSDRTTIDAIRANLTNAKLAEHIREKWKTLSVIRQMRMTEFFK